MALVGVSGEVYTVGFLTLEYFCLTKMSKGLYSHLLISFGVPVMTDTSYSLCFQNFLGEYIL